MADGHIVCVMLMAVLLGCKPAPVAPGAFVLSGVYGGEAADVGAQDGSAIALVGNVMRFAPDGTYSLHLSPCGGDAGPDAAEDFTMGEGCVQVGTYAIGADGTTLTLTDETTGASSTIPFDVLASEPVPDGGLGDGSVSTSGASDLHVLGGSLTTGSGALSTLVSPRQVTLYKANGVLYDAVPCSGMSSALGADTGAMIRTATATSFTCIESQIGFPSYDIPDGPNGKPYCTSFSESGCTASNYYGRRGVPFIYYTFVASGRAECGFEYQPGLATSNGAQGNPRWSPYIRDTAGAYLYGVGADQKPGTTATVWCGIESSGYVRMKINGSFVNMSTVGGGTTPLQSRLSFAGQAVHAFRVTGLAWPETMGSASKIASARQNGSYFPPYTCQSMNQLGPVTYTNTMVCPGSSETPSVRFVTSPGGNARWSAGGDGYTLSPTSEVKETQNGSTDTDLIFPGGG